MVEILRGVDAALQYDLVMYSAHTRHRKEATHVARLTRHLAEGLLLVLPQQAQTYLNTLRQRHFLHVLVDYLSDEEGARSF